MIVHELNLLPPLRRHLQTQEHILRLFNRLLARVALMVLLMALCSGILLLFFWMGNRPTAAHSELNQVLKQYKEQRTLLASLNTKLSTITELSQERLLWSERIREVLLLLPAGTTITVMGGNATEGQLTLSGQAPSRTVLIAIENRLRDLPWVDSVGSPSNNLLRRDNPPYQFILKLKQP